jgi:hypothetical protein
MENTVAVREDYEAFANFCIGLVGLVGVREEHIFQSIRHQIHDLKPIYSGYTSHAAIKMYKGRLTKMTKEHYNGRANSAREIVQMIKNKVGYQELLNFIKKSCNVHYTTPEENMKLVPYQNKENYNWEEAYAAAGIKLVKYQGIKIWYKIDGVKYYKTKKELQEFFDCSLYCLDGMIDEKGEEIVIG